MNQIKLDTGFLILEDWIGVLREMSAGELKKVLFALIDYQREGVPIPDFSKKSTQMVAKMLGNAVKRRVAGAAGGRRSAQVRAGRIGATEKCLPTDEMGEDASEVASERASEVASEVASELRREKNRREEKRIKENRIEEREREKGAPSAPLLPSGKEAPPPPKGELSDEELNFLEKQGVPPLYVKARLERAVMMAHAQGRSAAGVLLSWWWQDLAEGAGKKYLSAQAKDDHLSSFDVDDFFTAALEGTYGEG